MKLIVSGNMGLTIAKYRKSIRGLSRCRPWGFQRGTPVRIVSMASVAHLVASEDVSEIIWDECDPVEEICQQTKGIRNDQK